jgi:eukaryotic-like serine/threonine-protein kinase
VAGLPSGATTAAEVALGELESPDANALRYFGDYELETEIGRGGMGIVYRARQVSLNRQVALKMILAGVHASSQHTQRLKNEAESVAQLDHSNIVPLYEIGSHGGQMYYSMKLIEGRNLAECLQEYIDAPIPTARLLVTVARAVHHAHQRGILHRDLKPANILIDHQGVPHLTDFGLAKQIRQAHDLTQSGTILGTPNYMAPEQARGEKYLTTASDVYSLGAILYELLTGKPPFQSESWADVLRRLAEEEPAAPHLVNRQVPRDLSMICLKCLEKSPDRRYVSALELAEDLERWLRHEPVRARQTGPLRRAAKWVRRHPTLALFILSATLGLAGILWQWNRAVQANRRYLTELDQRRWELAEREWQANDEIHARQLLLKTPPDRRGWEWNYLWNVTYNTPFNRLPELETYVSAIAPSPDGRLLAVAEASGEIQVWDLQSGSLRQRLESEASCARLAFSPNGNYLLAIQSDQWQLWNIAAGTVQLESSDEEKADEKAEEVAWHPNGSKLYVASQFKNRESGSHVTIRCHDAESGRTLFVHLIPDEFRNGLHISTDGMRLYHLGSRQIIDAATGELLGELSLPDDAGQRYPTTKNRARVMALADDERVALLEPDYVSGRSLLILQRVGETDRVTFSVPDNSYSWYALSPDGGRLAVSIYEHNFDWDDIGLHEQLPLLGPLINSMGKRQPWISRVFLYDAATGRLLRTLRGFPSAATHPVFHPDGRRLIVGGGQREEGWQNPPRGWGDVVFWNIAESQNARVLEGHSAELGSLSLDPTGQVLASGAEDGTVRLWNLETGLPRPGSPVFTHRDPSQRPAWVGASFAPDSGLMAVGGGSTIQFMDGFTGQIQRTIEVNGEYSVHQVLLTPREQHLIYLTEKGATVYDLSKDAVVYQVPDTSSGYSDVDRPNRAALSPDGRLLALTYQLDADGEIRLYEVATGKLLWRHRTEPRMAAFRTGWGLINAGFSPDGRWVAAVGNNGPGLVFEVSRGTLRHQLEGHSSTVRGVTFSPDGSRIATGSYDRTIKIWNTTNGKEIHTLRGHEGSVHAVLFSPDGKRLVSGDSTGRVFIWETASEFTPVPAPSSRPWR